MQWPGCRQRRAPLPPFMQLFVSVPGAAEKPYMVEEAVSYNELDYISVSAGGEQGESRGSVPTSLAVEMSAATW